jgi:predicted 3-demethylubiquinone-9 3-methyltransferase (glyoxalase superfamily)
MQTIVPHLWFDHDAAQAAELYVKAIPGSRIVSRSSLGGTPSGEVEILRLSLAGYEIQILGAGPEFRVNPSLSFMVNCASAAEVDKIYTALKDGGSEMMPLGTYPFSERYVWLADRYGVSWQINFIKSRPVSDAIVPAQMFTGPNAGHAAQALDFYTKAFGGETVLVAKYGPGMEPNGAEMISHASFVLKGQSFALMDSAYDNSFAFNEAVSYVVYCDSQAEIDRYWSTLSAVPEAEACGWLKDRFGFSWQIVPRQLETLMSGDPARTQRVSQAFLKMKKFDIAMLEAAARGD